MTLSSPDPDGLWRSTADTYGVVLNVVPPSASTAVTLCQAHACIYDGALDTVAMGLQCACPLLWAATQAGPLESCWGQAAVAQGLAEEWSMGEDPTLLAEKLTKLMESNSPVRAKYANAAAAGWTRSGTDDIVDAVYRHLPEALTGLSLIHISEPTRLLSISYAVFCLKKKK